MHRVLVAASGFEDLLRAQNHGLPYRFDTIFSDASWLKRRRSRRAFRLLRSVDNELRGLLMAGEQVRSLTQGVCYRFWESYFLGWLLRYFNRRAIVLTNWRIILLQIDRRGRPKALRSQIRYPTIAKARGGLFGGLKVKFNDGDKIHMSGVPRAHRKLIRKLVDHVRGLDLAEGSRTGGKEELCPHCKGVVELGLARCNRCGGGFKSAKRAGLLSLVLPGLGDFYMGHRNLAKFEMTFALLAWIVVLLIPVLLESPEFPVTPGTATISALMVVFSVHLPDGVGTWYLARLGVYAERKGAPRSSRAVTARTQSA